MAIQVPDSLTSDYVAKVPRGTPFYSDGNLKDKLGEISDDHLNDTDMAGTVDYAGRVIGGTARAIIITTGTAYPDKESEPTIVYVAENKVTLIDAPLPSGGDTTARDKEWRTWLDTDKGAPDK